MIASVGDIFSDVADAVSDAVSAVGGGISDALADVPGLRDFANTAVGRTVLSALATSVTGGLAPLVGPQLATVAFAIPGVSAGDDFLTSWTQEFGRRVDQTVAILGVQAVPELNDAIQKAVDYLQSAGIDPAQITMTDLAKAAGVDDWSAAFVLDKALGQIHYLSNAFSPLTGNLLSGITFDLNDPVSTASLQRMQQAAAIRSGAIKTSVSAGPSVVQSLSLQKLAPAVVSTVRASSPTSAVRVAAPPSDKLLDVALVIGGLALAGGAAYYFSRR